MTLDAGNITSSVMIVSNRYKTATFTLLNSHRWKRNNPRIIAIIPQLRKRTDLSVKSFCFQICNKMTKTIYIKHEFRTRVAVDSDIVVSIFLSNAAAALRSFHLAVVLSQR